MTVLIMSGGAEAAAAGFGDAAGADFVGADIECASAECADERAGGYRGEAGGVGVDGASVEYRVGGITKTKLPKLRGWVLCGCYAGPWS